MAARIRKQHQDEIRCKIQTSQLINRLQNHALSDEGDLSPSRLKAIEILLKKSLPDVTSIELSGPDGGEIETRSTVTVEFVKSGEAKPS